MDITDRVTYFSNYGACVNVFAPGEDIISACNTATCGVSRNKYITKSGTSMACPHVTGMLAQLLQKSGNEASIETLSRGLICTATKGKLTVDALDTVSRNLLLHVPVDDDAVYDHQIIDHECDISLKNCSTHECSGKGVCLPTRVSADASQYYSIFYDGVSLLTGSQEGINCHCNFGYFGQHCQYSLATLLEEDNDAGTYTVTCPDHLAIVELELADRSGIQLLSVLYLMIPL